MNTDHKYLQYIAVPILVTALILSIPFIAMQFSPEVNWTPGDFAFAGTFLFGSGLIYKLVTRASDDISYRAAVCFALFTGLLLIWVNGAVGIIGSENNAINLIYFGVVLIGFVGALIVRFRPYGMVQTMFVMAAAQTLATAIALTLGMQNDPYSSVGEILGVNGFFAMLFVISGLLFKRVAKPEERPSEVNNTKP